MSPRAPRREPMLLLVIGLPAAAVVAGVATLLLAMGGGDAGDARVRRVAQAQNADLGPDRAASRLALRAELALTLDDALRLELAGDAPPARALELTLRHAIDPGRDRSARLVPAGGGVYLGRLDAPRAAGAHNVELVPEDAGWRLVGRLAADAAAVDLQPALEAPDDGSR